MNYQDWINEGKPFIPCALLQGWEQNHIDEYCDEMIGRKHSSETSLEMEHPVKVKPENGVLSGNVTFKIWEAYDRPFVTLAVLQTWSEEEVHEYKRHTHKRNVCKETVLHKTRGSEPVDEVGEYGEEGLVGCCPNANEINRETLVNQAQATFEGNDVGQTFNMAVCSVGVEGEIGISDVGLEGTDCRGLRDLPEGVAGIDGAAIDYVETDPNFDASYQWDTDQLRKELDENLDLNCLNNLLGATEELRITDFSEWRAGMKVDRTAFFCLDLKSLATWSREELLIYLVAKEEHMSRVTHPLTCHVLENHSELIVEGKTLYDIVLEMLQNKE